ncbi:hypothetical protein BSKO_11339 [Bryopsis sp. KO-2023]|nr:hypothetical protein BSKO_11339 [Bryopsis sp. KO-2023]
MKAMDTGFLSVAPQRMVVPPFKCAWLPDEERKFGKDRGGVVFEVCGENDATVMLKSSPGANRLQIEGCYCVIFGSNRNMCLRIERDGEKCDDSEDEWTWVSPREYKKYWLYFEDGTIFVGVGEPSSDFLYSWTDPSPLKGIEHVGLSSWDRHNSYRNFEIYSEPFGMMAGDSSVPRLRDLSMSALVGNLSVGYACKTLCVLAEIVIPGMTSLVEDVVTFLAKNFNDIGEDFAFLPCTMVCAVVTSRSLSAHCEIVYSTVESWAFYGEVPSLVCDLREEEEIIKVLKLIKFHFMDDHHLEEILCSPLAKRVSSLQSTVKEAIGLKHSMVEGMGTELMAHTHEYEDRFRPHSREHGNELVYTFDGDHKGVCHYLGTCSGKHPWVNPMTLKQLTIRASSPVGRFTIPKEIVGNRFLSTSYACPKNENGQFVTWWQVDLGPRKLICTRYSIRHDASDGYIRAWNLQGSNDGKCWVDLRRHLHDCTIKFTGAWGSWPVLTDKSYKMFRLLKTGPNASATYPDNLCLSSIEFYGILSCS